MCDMIFFEEITISRWGVLGKAEFEYVYFHAAQDIKSDYENTYVVESYTDPNRTVQSWKSIIDINANIRTGRYKQYDSLAEMDAARMSRELYS